MIAQPYPLWAVFENLSSRPDGGLIIPASCLVIGWDESGTSPPVWRPVMIDLVGRDGAAVVVPEQDERLIHYFTSYDEAIALRTYLTRGGAD